MNLRKRVRQMWVVAAMEAASTLGEDVLFLIQFMFRLLRVSACTNFSTAWPVN